MSAAAPGVQPPRRGPLARSLNLFLWLSPLVLVFYLYREGLRCWFIADDFAWLGLLRQYHSPADLWPILFAPAAQGTIRPWSERGFFLLFHGLFGLDNLPFRIAAFVTMLGDVLLLNWLGRRLTGSALAGFLAAILWSANAALVTPMSWSSAYNELLCPLFLLSALALFVRYAESGQWRFWWAQLLVFLLGFGALEINVVYPALAVSWALFVAPETRRRQLLLSQLPLVFISIVYFAVHRATVPFPSQGPYALHVDARIAATLLLYLKWSLLPENWLRYGHSRLFGNLILAASALALVAVFVSAFRRKQTPALFGAAWFLACLAPVLPLPDHRTDYYLTIPVIGLSLAAAYGYSRALRSSRRWHAAASTAALLYLCGMIPVSRSATHWWRQKTADVRAVVLGVESARQTHPGKVIVLDGIPAGVYSDSIGQGALYAAGFDFVYLTPGSEREIGNAPDQQDPDKIVLDPAVTFHALRQNSIVVYSLAGDHLRNITAAWERSAPERYAWSGDKVDSLPARLDVGNPLYSWLLGPGWLSSEAGNRWMTGKASVRLKIPQTGNKLLLEGYFTEEQLRQAPRHLMVFAAIAPKNGAAERGEWISLGETRISDPEINFRRLFNVPSAIAGKDAVDIEIRVDPILRKDGQEYGVVFGKVAILP